MPSQEHPTRLINPLPAIGFVLISIRVNFLLTITHTLVDKHSFLKFGWITRVHFDLDKTHAGIMKDKCPETCTTLMRHSLESEKSTSESSE
jgi:hypothetical protein